MAGLPNKKFGNTLIQDPKTAIQTKLTVKSDRLARRVIRELPGLKQRGVRTSSVETCSNI